MLGTSYFTAHIDSLKGQLCLIAGNNRISQVAIFYCRVARVCVCVCTLCKCTYKGWVFSYCCLVEWSLWPRREMKSSPSFLSFSGSAANFRLSKIADWSIFKKSAPLKFKLRTKLQTGPFANNCNQICDHNCNCNCAYLNLMGKKVAIYMGRTGPKDFGEIEDRDCPKKLRTAGLILVYWPSYLHLQICTNVVPIRIWIICRWV